MSTCLVDFEIIGLTGDVKNMKHMYKLQGKYSLESTDPRESEIRAPPQLTIALKLSCYLLIIAKLFKVKDGFLKFVYIGKKSPVYGVFGQ